MAQPTLGDTPSGLFPAFPKGLDGAFDNVSPAQVVMPTGAKVMIDGKEIALDDINIGADWAKSVRPDVLHFDYGGYKTSDGVECPFSDCDGTDNKASEADFEGAQVVRRLACTVCGREWIDTFKLALSEPDDDIPIDSGSWNGGSVVGSLDMIMGPTTIAKKKPSEMLTEY